MLVARNRAVFSWEMFPEPLVVQRKAEGLLPALTSGSGVCGEWPVGRLGLASPTSPRVTSEGSTSLSRCGLSAGLCVLLLSLVGGAHELTEFE